MIKIYNKDCFDFLIQDVEDQTIDLVIVDPPYNLKKADWDTFESTECFLNFTYRWIDSVLPKIKKTGSIYIFNTPFHCAFILNYLYSKGLKYRNWITWHKKDGLGGTKKKYVTEQESLLFFTMSDEYTFNADDIRIPYDHPERVKSGVVKNGKIWYPNPNGKLCTDVWYFTSERHKNKVNGKTPKLEHITPKPLEMIERIIKASSNENDLVLDCFLGSGTTAVACKKLNRNFIGCEKDKKYYDLALKRLEDNKAIIIDKKVDKKDNINLFDF